MLETASSPITKVKSGRGGFIVDIAETIIIALAISIFIYLVIAIPNQVDGLSMEPNFHDKELLLTDKVIQWLGNTPIGNSPSYSYQRGDIIIFHYRNADLIKRVIAGPGDKIRIHDNSVFVNGKLVDEKYIPTTTRTRVPLQSQATLQDNEELTIPENYYFAMGDNRENSKDSRFADVGLISRDQIKGRVMLRYWPIDKFGIIRRGEFEEKEITQ